MGEVEEIGRPAPVIEVLRKPADFRQISERPVVLAVAGLDCRQSDHQSEVEVGLDTQARPHHREDSLDQSARLSHVALQVLAVGHPVPRQRSVRLATKVVEYLRGLGSCRCGFRAAIEPRQCLSPPPKQLRARTAAWRFGQMPVVDVESLLPATAR